MINHILVICIGNICRSPMGEALLRHALQSGPACSVASAGLGALVGKPAAEHSIELMKLEGIDITDHRAQQITPDLIANADLILVMEAGHKSAIVNMDPSVRGKVYRFGKWQDVDIPDPYGMPREDYEHALTLIKAGVVEWAKRIRT